MVHVPTLNFNDSSLYQFSGLGDGTSPLLTRLTSAMASSMEILPIRAITPNTTYRHEFVGPSLQCEPAKGGRLANMSAIWNETESTLSASNGGELKYLSHTMEEEIDTGNGNSDLNATIFVRDCVTGDAYEDCWSSYGPAISARVRNESITCAVYHTLFDIDFSAVGDTNYHWRAVQMAEKSSVLQSILGIEPDRS
ncbi:hypothetical protein NX059_003185 [Plenodomus lindquistii]|nr:hypothetical protein NX059_003185 [Plenodomus lindquistii]